MSQVGLILLLVYLSGSLVQGAFYQLDSNGDDCICQKARVSAQDERNTLLEVLTYVWTQMPLSIQFTLRDLLLNKDRRIMANGANFINPDLDITPLERVPVAKYAAEDDDVEAPRPVPVSPVSYSTVDFSKPSISKPGRDYEYNGDAEPHNIQVSGNPGFEAGLDTPRWDVKPDAFDPTQADNFIRQREGPEASGIPDAFEIGIRPETLIRQTPGPQVSQGYRTLQIRPVEYTYEQNGEHKVHGPDIPNVGVKPHVTPEYGQIAPDAFETGIETDIRQLGRTGLESSSWRLIRQRPGQQVSQGYGTLQNGPVEYTYDQNGEHKVQSPGTPNEGVKPFESGQLSSSSSPLYIQSNGYPSGMSFGGVGTYKSHKVHTILPEAAYQSNNQVTEEHVPRSGNVRYRYTNPGSNSIKWYSQGPSGYQTYTKIPHCTDCGANSGSAPDAVPLPMQAAGKAGYALDSDQTDTDAGGKRKFFTLIHTLGSVSVDQRGASANKDSNIGDLNYAGRDNNPPTDTVEVQESPQNRTRKSTIIKRRHVRRVRRH